VHNFTNTPRVKSHANIPLPKSGGGFGDSEEIYFQENLCYFGKYKTIFLQKEIPIPHYSPSFCKIAYLVVIILIIE